jgi:O-acetyl-ADP-ribose deacetylase (regulator of RNase III)
VVYDGAQDLGLWRPPGKDRDVWDAYGTGLKAVLDKEKKRVPGGKLPVGGILRLHPGKLHCDFLVWVASRPGHGTTEQAPAPTLAVVEDMARRVVEFLAGLDVVRVAFPVLGAGPGEADPAERMAAIVRAVAAYKEACFAAERPMHIEEVIVCDPSAAVVSKAKRLVAKLARTGFAAEVPAASKASSAASKTREPARKVTGTTGRARRGKLNIDDVATARARSLPYDRSRTYYEGQWFIHTVFGVGQVQTVRPERMVVVLFENNDERTLIHAR